MKPWKPLLALIAISAFLTAIYPLVSFAYSSLDGKVNFGTYYSLLGETLCITLNVSNGGSVSLDNFSATVVVNSGKGIEHIILLAGDVGPGENVSVSECVAVGEDFSIEEVTFRFTIAGMYPLKVVYHGRD